MEKTEDRSKKDIRREKIRERLDKRIVRLEARRDKLADKEMFGLTSYEIEKTYRKANRLRRKVAGAKLLLLLMGSKNSEGGKCNEKNRRPRHE